MKNFLSAFFMSMFVLFMFLFFGGGLVFQSVYGILMFSSLIFAAFITGFMSQEAKISELEKRVKALENQEGEFD
jgi:uncharacterized membrane protein YciS (DUF1049 family)